MRIKLHLSRWLGTALIAVVALAIGGIADFGKLNGTLGIATASAQSASSVRPPTTGADKWSVKQPGQASKPGGDVQKWGSKGNLSATTGPQASNSSMWRDIRKGLAGTVSIPNKQAAQLIHSQGELWRQYRNTTLFNIGAWILLVTVVVIALFFIVRGRIKVDGGQSGKTVQRFNSADRFAHWLTATSFIILGLTGLNMLYGKNVIMPIIGKPAFAWITEVGKVAHNYIGYAFILGIVMMLFLWIRHNLPDRYDVPWLLKGGGILSKAHPPAKQFNAGQKLIFWSVVGVGGGMIAYTGVLLMFPESRVARSPACSRLQILARLGLALVMICDDHRPHLYRQPRHGRGLPGDGLGARSTRIGPNSTTASGPRN